MIRRHIIMSAAAATVMLSSCSGDKSKPSPTPTATATPTPTPTASPTYAALPLAATAAAEFTTINASTNFTGDPTAGAVTLGAWGTESRSDRVRLAVSGAIATAGTNYVIREATEESRFVPADLTTTSAAGNQEYVFRTTSTATGALTGNFSQLEFLNNTITGSVTSDTLLGSLARVSYGNWYRAESAVGAKRLTYTVFGYPTAATDMPTTGTQAYTVAVRGRVVNNAGGVTTINTIGGTATVSVNFSTGLVDITFNLTQTTAGGATAAYATFAAQGAIPAGQNQFTGAFASGAPLSGTIAGGFFGSQGAEIGITFAGSGTNARLVGEVVGKKS
ncbi:MAG: hypothetical protein KF730_16765 [Sphingomonas sp.]|uniref:hypothetical protein n=1 Tax=Sphingomonas sp. TaxID=28214 RepID=UPI0025F118F7|nr:hypothetical protein [Sphingomonas sp.]MBX3566214.1 hypothetical protein [Sphingomonas sp.]